MLSSITPLGERGRGRKWGATVTAFVAGSVAGGAALGWLAGGLGSVLARLVPTPPARLALAVAAAAALAAALADLRARGRPPLPTVRRQVNEDWLETYRGWVVGLGFGAQLGAGLATIVTTAAVHLVFALALLAARPLAGLALGALFGLARALPLLAAGRATAPAGLARLHQRLERTAPAASAATSAVLALAALALGLAAAVS
jgi:hypothetical protein